MELKRIGDHAVVIGASIAGLLAARVLADRFGRVTVIDRDELPAGPEPRKGVPQGQHAHGLLARGREIVEDLFPGFTDELVAQGAHKGDIARDMLWHAAGGFHASYECGLTGLISSRPLLESHIRARLLALGNVSACDRTDVLGLVSTEDRERVTGVRVRREGREETMAADLVVEAGGGASRAAAFLEALGYAPPREERIRVEIGYLSRFYRRRPDQLGGKLGIVVTTQPPNPRGAAALAQEGGRWIVSVCGYFGAQPAGDEAGFEDALAQLPSRAILDLVRTAEPIGEFRQFKFPANLRRRFEKLARFPEGFLAFGDAICRFNPVYGQGMSSAALQALALRDCLAEGSPRLWRAFFRRAARVIDAPWQIAAGADLAYPEVQGPRGPMVRFFNWYVERLHRAAHRDEAVSLAFLEAANLIQPPPSILAPGVVRRVVRANFARRASSAAGPLGAPTLKGTKAG